MDADALLGLLRRFQSEGVEYILVGGHAVRLNGFVRATEDIDILLPSSIENGRRVIIRTLDIEGLLKTKTDYRAKDRIDREVLLQLRSQLMVGGSKGA